MEISQKEISKHLKGRYGSELMVYDLIGSTNDAAKLLAKNGASHGSVVVAKRQNSARGRLGRSFFAPASGLYMSVVLRPHAKAGSVALVTSATAVAVARAIEKNCGISVKIKWVNDLYARGKKLCGILVECAVCHDGLAEYVVVGIGVNTHTEKFPLDISDKVTSLSLLGAEVDENALCAEILLELETVCETLEKREFIAEYKARSCVIGKTVEVLHGERKEIVSVLDIDDEAGLIVETKTHERQVIRSGEVSLKGDFT